MSVDITIENRIAQIVITRPEKRNTLDLAHCQALSEAFQSCEANEQVRSIVLCGQNNVFCAGLDIEQLTSEPQPLLQAFSAVVEAIDECGKPIVAAVNGPAVAHGVVMLYHADLVYCGEHALFSLPLVALGLTPQYGLSVLAVRAAGYKLACQKMLLSEPISPAEAVAMGFVNGITSDDKVMTQASATAARLALLPPLAVRETKQLLRETYMEGVSERAGREQAIFERLLQGHESREAFSAFIEKRAPNFS